MRTGDQEWAFNAICKHCEKSSRHEEATYMNALWMCPQCNKVHVIMKHEDSVSYDHNDSEKKAELKQIYIRLEEKKTGSS